MVRQLWPPSLVWNRTLAPKYSTCGSSGENSSGIVRTQRYFPARTGSGETSCTWPVLQSKRVTLPPYTMVGCSGSGAM